MNLLVIFGALMIGVLIVATLVKYLEVSKAQRWEQAPGRVLTSQARARKVRTVESRTGAEGGADRDVRNFAEVTYEYRVAGKTYRGKRISIGEDLGDMAVEQRLARYPVGASVTVYYDPQQPDQAVLERNAPAVVWRTLAILIAVCIALLIGATIGFPVLIDAARANLARPERALPIVILGAMALMVIAVARAAIKQAQAAQAWPAVEGEIESADVESFRVLDLRNSFRMSRVFRPAIVYRYRVGGVDLRGSRLHFASRLYSGAPGYAQRVVERYPRGSRVAVYYNPDNAAESVLQPQVKHLWIAWTVAGVLAAAALALAYI